MNLTNSSSDIAIVGMSALFPGAKNLNVYWQNIFAKVSAIQEAPDEWALPYFDPDSQENDRIYTRKGGFLGELAEFDPTEFGIMPASVDGGEPDHFLALRLAVEALRDAGYGDGSFNGETTGIILGRGTYINRGYNTLLQHGQIVDQTLGLLQQFHPNLDAQTLSSIRQQLKASLPPFTAEMVPGLVPNVITGRIANRLNLMGPNYIVDAACASSLIAVELAIKELLDRNCDMMLAGGVHASTPPQINMIFCRIGALAREGICPFDQATTGTLLGEGMGILVLKRLADAERDGDRIYAVLKGIGSSSDGKAYGLLAPRQEGEVLALQRAYANSGVDPVTVGLIEAHGTGIPLGDQTEVRSLTQVFGPRQGELPRCALGSVKSMIGHCIPAAGAAGLIKTALALYHKVLPPTLCNQVNPALGIEATPFYINTEPRPWIHGGETPRRAGVNSFGFGGINAHAVLEEYAPAPAPQLLHSHWPTELLVFAAPERSQLLALLEQVLQALHLNPQLSLAELALSLSDRPLQAAHRLAIVATDIPDLQTKLTQAIAKLQEPQRTKLQTRSGLYYTAAEAVPPPGKIAFLFPGEGSQYPNMLLDLCLHFPEVRAWFDHLDATFSDRDTLPSHLIFPAPTSLTPATRQGLEAQLFSMDLASETVFTASMALHSLLLQFGITAEAMVGHSTGEFAALIASGVVRLSDRADLMAKMRHLNQIYRQLETSDRIPKGTLVTVGGVEPQSLEALLSRFGGQLHLAMDNCPNQAVLFGATPVMEQAVAELKALGGICTLLPFDRAYHTPLFTEVGAAFRSFYDSLDVGPGKVPLYSCAIAGAFPEEPEGIRSLAAQQWSQRVRFSETLEKLYSEGITTFIEVGPRSNLTGFAKDILQKRECLLLASNHPSQTGLEQIQHLLARLWTQHHAVDLSALFQQRLLGRIDLEAAAATPLPQKTRPVLTLSMPRLQLQPDFVAQIQPQLTPAPDQIAPAQAVPPIAAPTAAGNPALIEPKISPTPVTTSNGMASTPGGRTEPSLPETSAMASGWSETIAQPRVAASALPPSSLIPSGNGGTLHLSEDLAAVSAHFELMQAFLESQGRVMSALLAETPEIAAANPAIAAQIPTQASPWPLLGEILTWDNQQLVCQRHFDLEQDIFLFDHTLGGEVSQWHPQLFPLPVIPFTISMEILAEAAALLVGGDKPVISMFNLRGYRWLALDQGHLTLRIEAQLQPQPQAQIWEVHVRLYQVGADAATAVFEGDVRLAAEFAPAPPPLPFELAHSSSSWLADENLYRTGMFHGPRFQGVKHIHRWGPEGIEADLQVISIDDFFQGLPQPQFQIDPGLLDAAGQLVGYWIAEQYGVGFNVFPFQVRAFHQYEPMLPPDTLVLGRGLIGFIGDRFTEASFDFIHPSGRVIARLEGWQDRYFEIPDHYRRCRLEPQTAFFSEPWDSQTTGICRRIEPLPDNFLEDSWGIWGRVLAQLVLNHTERQHWYSLPEKSSDRRIWLLGQIAAKDALRQWAKQTYGLEFAPADLEIVRLGPGLAQGNCPELLALGPIPEIYLYHDQGAILASLSPL